jgi:hypothetical protein
VKGKFFDGKKRRVERPSLKQVPSKATGEGAEPEETENSCMKEELVDFPREGISSSLGSLSILECERRSRDSVPLPTGNEPLISILKSPPPGSVLPGCSLGSSADFEGVPDMQGTEGESKYLPLSVLARLKRQSRLRPRRTPGGYRIVNCNS